MMLLNRMLLIVYSQRDVFLACHNSFSHPLRSKSNQQNSIFETNLNKKYLLNMSGAVKKLSTGLTGLVVAKNPHHQLASLYGKTLRALAQMPETAAYRVNTEKIIRERAHIVATTQQVTDIEAKIGCGQVEELLVQAENELLLARKFLSWKPWEPLARQAPARQWDWPPVKIQPQQ